MAHLGSQLSHPSNPPQYRKSSINQRKYRADDEDSPAPLYSRCTADDKLPPYAPTIQLLTLCRRKNEMDSKDKKARNRKWQLVWLLLDGTALRIYQPNSAEKKKFEKDWNEKYCVKKGSSAQKVPVKREEDSDEEDEVEEVDTIREVPRTRTGRGRSSSMLKTPFQEPSTSTSRPLPVPTRRRTNTITHPSLNLTLPTHPSLSTILKRIPQISHPVRNLSCTRATTYFKRNFVLRFVLEDGTQFIVQLNSYEETLVWLQVVPMAAPLALDLDERQMPDPAPYPRMRRRVEDRPSTAPAVMDSTVVRNVPPEYFDDSPSSTAPSTPMRRRSLDII